MSAAVSWLFACCIFASVDISTQCRKGKSYCGRDLAVLDVSAMVENRPLFVPRYTYDYLYICHENNQPYFYACAYGCGSTATYAYCKCEDGRRYCGDELNIWSGWSGFAARTVYECNSAGDSAQIVKECIGTCSHGQCRQDCVVNKTYCGRDLAMLEGWESVVGSHRRNYFYICHENNLPHYYACDYGCESTATYTHCKCQAGRRYCGDELNEIKGWFGWTARATYECTSTGNGVQKVKDCIGTCSHGQCRQDCVVNKTYCGRDLAMLEGWETVVQSHKHEFYYICDKVNLVTSSQCTFGCASLGTNAYCQCKSGRRYCGHELNQLNGWDNWDKNTVYTCADGTVSMTSSLESCGNRTCSNGNCKPKRKSRWQRECHVDRLYCGYELQQFQFSITFPKNVYRCLNKTHVVINESCSQKCIKNPHAHCPHQCTVGYWYCGHELQELGFRNATNSVLYSCDSPLKVTPLKQCEGACAANMENSTCVPKDYSRVFSECGSLKSDTIPLVAHGHTTERKAWPWMVSLQINATHQCGGILIDKKWVLTAAHCVNPSSALLAVLGEYRQLHYDKGQVSMTIASIVHHPSYDESSMENDIALIQLAQEATYDQFVRPICLPSPGGADPLPGRLCAVAGWGQMFMGVKANALQFGYLNILNNDLCYNAFNKTSTKTAFSFNSDIMICAGHEGETENVITCQGDSGGPLMCQGTDGTWTVYGIVSYGPRSACAITTVPLRSVFTKVSQFGSWIRETMNNITLSNRTLDSNSRYNVASILDDTAASVDTNDGDYYEEGCETTSDDEGAPVEPQPSI